MSRIKRRMTELTQKIVSERSPPELVAWAKAKLSGIKLCPICNKPVEKFKYCSKHTTWEKNNYRYNRMLNSQGFEELERYKHWLMKKGFKEIEAKKFLYQLTEEWCKKNLEKTNGD